MIGICNQCGKKDVITKGLCKKHYDQLLKYGKCLDSNPRTKYDKNEYIIHGDYTEVFTYNIKNEVDFVFLIDTEDLPLIIKHKWNHTRPAKQSDNILVYMSNNDLGLFHRVIMGNPKGSIDHINRNTLDNRKSNLRLASFSLQCFNSVRKGSRFDIKGIEKHIDPKRKKRFMARFTYKRKTYRSAWYYTYEEAVFARYLLQQLCQEEIINGDMSKYINKLTNEQKRPIIKWFKNRFKNRV